MEFITRLPLSKSFSVIFVVIDHLSKYGHFICLKLIFFSLVVVDAFITHMVKLHAIPHSIVSD